MNIEKTLNDLGFPLGSKVVMVGEDPNRTIEIGEIGTVCHYHKYIDGCDVGVEWETKRPENHNCYGSCKSGHGRYVPHGSISHANLDFGEFDTSGFTVDSLFTVTE